MIHNDDHEKCYHLLKNIFIKEENCLIKESYLNSENGKIIINHEKHYSSFHKESSLNKENKNKKILIIFNGLNSNYESSVKNRVNSFFNQKNCLFDEIIVLKYPKYTFSMEGIFYYNDKKEKNQNTNQIKNLLNRIIQKIRYILHKYFHYDGLIGYCERILKNLLEEKQYNFENISFFTYSAGGGIAARTLKRFSSNQDIIENKKFYSIVHCNSFNKSYKVTGSLFNQEKDQTHEIHKISNLIFKKIGYFIYYKIFKNIFSGLMYIISLGYHVNAENAYFNKNFPVQKKGIFYTENDEIINYEASLYNACNQKDLSFLNERNISLYKISNPFKKQDKYENHCYIDFDSVSQFYSLEEILNNQL